jgi:hypothetical protein
MLLSPITGQIFFQILRIAIKSGAENRFQHLKKQLIELNLLVEITKSYNRRASVHLI